MTARFQASLPVRIILLALAALAALPAAGRAQAPFLVRDVRVFDGERTLEHRSVLVDSGRIVRIGGPGLDAPGAQVIDGRGRTLLPGLIDSHVHVADDVHGALHQALVFGVTTVLDMFSGGARFEKIKQARAEDAPDVADVRSAGVGATVPGGHPTQMGGGPIPTLKRPEEAQAFVDARIADGSDYIKIIRDDLHDFSPNKPAPTLDSATIAALVRAAHARGKLAVVHIVAEPDARMVLGAGANGLAHLFTGEHAGPDFGEFVARHHAFVIPTLETLYSTCPGRADGPALLADSSIAPYLSQPWRRTLAMSWPAHLSCAGTDEALRQLIRAHVPILAGTDSPIPGTAYGASLLGELGLLVRGGMTPAQALTAATAAPARAFGLDDRGRIRSGMRADLLLVDGDPTQDILATRRIVAVWKRGMPVARTRVEASVR